MIEEKVGKSVAKDIVYRTLLPSIIAVGKDDPYNLIDAYETLEEKTKTAQYFAEFLPVGEKEAVMSDIETAHQDTRAVIDGMNTMERYCPYRNPNKD